MEQHVEVMEQDVEVMEQDVEVTEETCVFCGIVAGSEPSTLVSETESTLAFMDINPGSDGHLLVIPKRHSTDLRDIGAEDLAAVVLEAQRVAKAAFDVWDLDGVNLLNCCGPVAWQTVFHFHMHVIARYADKSKDRLRLPFTPGVAGDPDAIAKLAAPLQRHLAD